MMDNPCSSNTTIRRIIRSSDRVRIELEGDDHRTLLIRLIEHLSAAGVVREVDHSPWAQQAENSSFVYLRMISDNHASGMVRFSQTFRNVSFNI